MASTFRISTLTWRSRYEQHFLSTRQRGRYDWGNSRLDLGHPAWLTQSVAVAVVARMFGLAADGTVKVYGGTA